MKEKIQKFMMGRYGVDAFSRFLIAVFFVLSVINLLINKASIYYLSLAVMLYAYFRFFSKIY